MRVAPERLVQGSESFRGRHPRRSLAPRMPGSGGVCRLGQRVLINKIS